jgi:hypothetical protein
VIYIPSIRGKERLQQELRNRFDVRGVSVVGLSQAKLMRRRG